jgi:hypothetical protein
VGDAHGRAQQVEPVSRGMDMGSSAVKKRFLFLIDAEVQAFLFSQVELLKKNAEH